MFKHYWAVWDNSIMLWTCSGVAECGEIFCSLEFCMAFCRPTPVFLPNKRPSFACILKNWVHCSTLAILWANKGSPHDWVSRCNLSFSVFFARLVTQWCFKECFSLANGFKVDSFCAGRVALWANEIFRLKMKACVNWGSLVLCKSTCTVQMNGFSYDWVTCGTWCLSGLLQK